MHRSGFLKTKKLTLPLSYLNANGFPKTYMNYSTGLRLRRRLRSHIKKVKGGQHLDVGNF